MTTSSDKRKFVFNPPLVCRRLVDALLHRPYVSECLTHDFGFGHLIARLTCTAPPLQMFPRHGPPLRLWRGLLATRVGEASHPGPTDIVGAALMEAHLPHVQATCVQYVDASRSSSAPPKGTAQPPLQNPAHGSAPRRTGPLDSTQPPLSKRHASSPSRWYCPVPGTRTPLKSSIPLGARDLWSTCLGAALAGVIARRDSRAWSDQLSLPSLVIPSPSRGGTSRTQAINQRNKAPMPGLAERGSSRAVGPTQAHTGS